MTTIYVVGSANADLVVNIPTLPRPGETVTGGRFTRFQGGKGANQAVACARLRSEAAAVVFVGALGDDAFGASAQRALDEEGVDISHVETLREAPTGVAFILVDGRGENMISVAPGANRALTADRVNAALGGAREGDVLLLSMEIPIACVRSALHTGRARGLTCLLNPAPMPADGVGTDLLDDVDVLLPNRLEAVQLLGAGACTGWPPDAEAMLAFTARHATNLIVTGGGDGVCAALREERKCVLQPAHPVEPVDTVGAGDCFAGALAVAVSEQRSWKERLRFATVAAGLSVTRPGAQASMPRREEVDRVP